MSQTRNSYSVLFSSVHSIPLPKVEPIKVWIAKVAIERIDECIYLPMRKIVKTRILL